MPTADATGVAMPRRRHIGWIAVIATSVVVADQLAKSWALDNLAHRSIPLFWTLRLNLSFNYGIAFSQGSRFTTAITVVGLVLVAGLVWWAARITRRGPAVALALLLGGACGNLSDRLFRDHGGSVIDFIDLQWWPIFNLADVALTAGAILLIITTLREPPVEAAEEQAR